MSSSDSRTEDAWMADEDSPDEGVWNSNIAAAKLTMEAAASHIAVLADPRGSRAVSLVLLFAVIAIPNKAEFRKNNRVGPCGPVAKPDENGRFSATLVRHVTYGEESTSQAKVFSGIF